MADAARHGGRMREPAMVTSVQQSSSRSGMLILLRISERVHMEFTLERAGVQINDTV